MAQWKGSWLHTKWYRVRITDVLLLQFDLKLFNLRFKIKLKRNFCKKDGGPVERLWTLHPKVWVRARLFFYYS